MAAQACRQYDRAASAGERDRPQSGERGGEVDGPEPARRRTVRALIVVWRYSRHCFVWPTTSQTLGAVVEGLEAAWACFEGVPRYLVIDNVPAAVAGADPLHPRATRGFLEYARHRGFITDPARVRRPPATSPGSAQRPVRARALLRGRPVPRPRRDALRGPISGVGQREHGFAEPTLELLVVIEVLEQLRVVLHQVDDHAAEDLVMFDPRVLLV